MEISTFELYLILKLTDIIESLYVIEIISFFALILYGIFGFIYVDSEYGDSKETAFHRYKNRLTKYISALITAVVLTAFIPNTKQVAALYILPPVINNEQVQQLPSELLDVLGLSLERVKELLEKTEESSN